jgi:uncharacterized protein DUF3305
MAPLRHAVDVVVERIPLASRWASERWQPVAVEMASLGEPVPAADARAPGDCDVESLDASGDRWRCKGFEFELHPTEAEGYFLNITSPDPRVFVMWRPFDDGRMPPVRPVLVTVSYNQAGRFMDGGEQVEGVRMLPEIASAMRAFVAIHYKPEPRRKVKRNDPHAAEPGDAQGGRNG